MLNSLKSDGHFQWVAAHAADLPLLQLSVCACLSAVTGVDTGYPDDVHAQEPSACHRAAGFSVSPADRHSAVRRIPLWARAGSLEPFRLARSRLFSSLR